MASKRCDEVFKSECDLNAHHAGPHVKYKFIQPEPSSPSVDNYAPDYLITQCRAAAAKVRELDEELRLRNQEIEDWRLRHQNLSQKYAALRAKLQAVRVQLLFFGSHEDHCIWAQSDYRQCSCGFNDAAEAARTGK